MKETGVEDRFILFARAFHPYAPQFLLPSSPRPSRRLFQARSIRNLRIKIFTRLVDRYKGDADTDVNHPLLLQAEVPKIKSHKTRKQTPLALPDPLAHSPILRNTPPFKRPIEPRAKIALETARGRRRGPNDDILPFRVASSDFESRGGDGDRAMRGDADRMRRRGSRREEGGQPGCLDEDVGRMGGCKGKTEMADSGRC